MRRENWKFIRYRPAPNGAAGVWFPQYGGLVSPGYDPYGCKKRMVHQLQK